MGKMLRKIHRLSGICYDVDIGNLQASSGAVQSHRTVPAGRTANRRLQRPMVAGVPAEVYTLHGKLPVEGRPSAQRAPHFGDSDSIDDRDAHGPRIQVWAGDK